MTPLDRNQLQQKSTFPTTTNLDRYLVVPPVEDGNAPSGVINQGFIYTAESIDDFYYDTEYSSPVLSVTSRRSSTNVGYVYEIVVEYTAKEAPTANTPGLYGSNLIKKGDFFTVTSLNDSHSYVRGAVVDVLDVTVSGPVADVYTYEYNLLCNISDGDALLIEAGDNFVWKRRIFTDAANEPIKAYPTDLLATLRSDGVYFRWIDQTGDSYKYNLRVREEKQSDGGGITYFKAPGVRANGNGAITLLPFLGTTGAYFKTITTVKIIDAGAQYSVNPTIRIVGTGTGASLSCVLDDSGSIKKETYRVYEADYTTGEISITTKNPTYEPFTSAYVENLSEDVCVDSVTNLGDGNWTITLIKTSGDAYTFNSSYADSLIDKELTVHTGILVINGGNDYRRTAYTDVKKFSDEDIYYIPAGSLTAGGYYWSVCSIFSQDNKTYSEWTPESYIKVM